MAAVVVTDLTRMSGTKICLAGYTLENNRPIMCVRPEIPFEQLTESWLYSSQGILRPFSVVDFALQQPNPDPPHTEDWTINRRYSMVDPFAEHLVSSVLDATCSRCVRDLYGDELLFERSWYVPAGAGAKSLGTIRPKRALGFSYRWRSEYRKWDYRIEFDDENGDHFRLSVTDLCLRYLLDYWKNVERLTADDAAKSCVVCSRKATRFTSE